MLQQLLPLLPVPEGPSDGSDPLGTAHGVMVVKDAQDRLLIPHAAASEQGDEAQQFLQRCKARGLKVTVACAEDAQSFPAASQAVYPAARGQAEHCQTVQHVWGHLKQSLFSSRRQGKASGAAQQEEACLAVAQQ